MTISIHKPSASSSNNDTAAGAVLHKYRFRLLVLGICCAAIFFGQIVRYALKQPTEDVLEKQVVAKQQQVFTNNNINNNNNNNDGNHHKSKIRGTKNGSKSSSHNDNSKTDNCQSHCADQKQARMELFGGDILDRAVALEMVKKERDKLIEKLRRDYGNETFETLYVDKEKSSSSENSEQRYRGISPASENGHSIATLKRKFMIKILKVQVSLLKRSSNSSSGCNCLETTEASGTTLDERSLSNDQDNDNINGLQLEAVQERYVWATGGHSSAAGHGNLYNETYTAYMERDLKPLFASLGIDFETRNYAMGGTNSGYEVSGCFDQIYGSNIDFFSWDFGMTDQRHDGYYYHYGYRGGMNAGHPGMVGLRIDGKKQLNISQSLEEAGIATFVLPHDVEMQMRNDIPDSEGLSDAELDALPPFIRSFKCSGKIESGDPYCGRDKYSKEICPTRRLRVSWHPGYKSHAFDGHILSLFVLQHFYDTVKDLLNHEEKDPERLLARLQQEDDALYEKLLDSPAPKQPPSGKFILSSKAKHWDEENPDVVELMFKGRSICRTARLPAESRYLGYTTNTNKTGGVAPLGQETYDVGINAQKVYTEGSESDEEVTLVYVNDGRYRDYKNSCGDTVVKPDYKDYFLVTSDQGWVKMTFPNPAEKEAYGYDSSQFKGLLSLESVICPWDDCPSKEVRLKHLGQGLEMTVNGKNVTYVDSHGIGYLEGEHGKYWEPSENGDYEIAIRVSPLVNKTAGYFRLSDIILY